MDSEFDNFMLAQAEANALNTINSVNISDSEHCGCEACRKKEAEEKAKANKQSAAAQVGVESCTCGCGCGDCGCGCSCCETPKNLKEVLPKKPVVVQKAAPKAAPKSADPGKAVN